VRKWTVRRGFLRIVGEELMWEMHDKEFEAVRSLPPVERYFYTIKRVADWEVL
jgi:hypothetical protein